MKTLLSQTTLQELWSIEIARRDSSVIFFFLTKNFFSHKSYFFPLRVYIRQKKNIYLIAGLGLLISYRHFSLFKKHYIFRAFKVLIFFLNNGESLKACY